jgi:glycine hydroxymethyltransferase
MTVDLRPIKMTGKKASAVLEGVHITCNKNAVPNDPEKPMVTSGIRLGTPAVTTRGMGLAEMELIGKAIADTLKNPEDEAVKAGTLATVKQLCDKFPLYKNQLVSIR